jgi:hypothetical protein
MVWGFLCWSVTADLPPTRVNEDDGRDSQPATLFAVARHLLARTSWRDCFHGVGLVARQFKAKS